MVAKALRHFFNISIGMPFVHKMYGRIGLCMLYIRIFISKYVKLDNNDVTLHHNNRRLF